MPPQVPWRLTGLFLLMALLMVVPQMMVVAVGLNFVVWAMVAAIRLSSLMISWRRSRYPPTPAPSGGWDGATAWLERLEGGRVGFARTSKEMT